MADLETASTRSRATTQDDSMFSNLNGRRVMHIGSIVTRFALVFILVVVGALKFTPAETMAIQPLVTHSPLFGWMNGAFGVMGTSRIFGVIEIVAGLLIAARLFSPRLSALGSAIAVVVFLSTLSFLVTTPGFDLLSMTTQFLSKDLILLGASVWILGESLFAGAHSDGVRE